MLWRFLASIAVLVALIGASAAYAVEPGAATSSLVAAAVSAQLGEPVRVHVEVLQLPAGTVEPVAAVPMPGARFGVPARFLLTLADGHHATIVARVNADAARAVASRNLTRDAELTAADVEWVEGPLDGQLLEKPLPTVAEVLGNRTRRAIARGEVISSALVRTPDAVRAGDPLTLVIRRGPIEVRGTGRAISSGAVGDVIRVLRPNSREPLQARVLEPAVVEILR